MSDACCGHDDGCAPTAPKTAAGTPGNDGHAHAATTASLPSSRARRNRTSRRSAWSGRDIRPRSNELRGRNSRVGKRQGAELLARRGLGKRRSQS